MPVELRHIYHILISTMINFISLTSAQLNHAADLKEKISALEQELASIVGAPAATTPALE